MNYFLIETTIEKNINFYKYFIFLQIFKVYLIILLKVVIN
jgi:hypothetical protein